MSEKLRPDQEIPLTIPWIECLTKVTASEKALLQAKEEEITKLREQIELLQSVPSSLRPDQEIPLTIPWIA
jgi:hypothetical protein